MGVVLNLVQMVQILSAVGMIVLILFQQGKGADMGAAFGSGTSGSLFGASGSANFLSRATALLATLFFICTLSLAYFGGVARTGGGSSVLERAANAAAPAPMKAASKSTSQIPSASTPVTAPSTAASAPVASASRSSATTSVPTPAHAVASGAVKSTGK